MIGGWLWLGISFVLATLWANVVWFFQRYRPGIAGKAIDGLMAWRFSPLLFQLLRLLYYVGLPFAALLWGQDAVIGRLLGLQRFELPITDGATTTANWLDWIHDAGWAAGLGIGALGLLALGGWAYRRASTSPDMNGEDVAVGADASGRIFLREAAYHELHWAFYRNAPIAAFGLYWGVWAGLALVGLEAVANPAWRRDVNDPRRAPAQLRRAALAVVSSVLFLYTQNLWLALLLHWISSWGLNALYAAPSSTLAREGADLNREA